MAATGSSTAVETVRLEPQELKRRLDSGERFTLIDVRGPSAWDSSNEKIVGAIRVDPFHFQIDPAWPRDRPTVLYCT
jgi:rhodanese-related sulfurtransferase